MEVAFNEDGSIEIPAEKIELIIKMKLERIKVNYPKYYEKIKKSLRNQKKGNPFWIKEDKEKDG